MECLRKRVAHFYTEQDRVEKGAEAWANGDIEIFGQLMFESGLSSFYQQESGIPEMETIYNILKEIKGVCVARPSGADYRGAVIGLDNPEFKDQIKARIDEVYLTKHPEYKDVYEVNFCKTDDSARIVNSREFE